MLIFIDLFVIIVCVVTYRSSRVVIFVEPFDEMAHVSSNPLIFMLIIAIAAAAAVVVVSVAVAVVVIVAVVAVAVTLDIGVITESVTAPPQTCESTYESEREGKLALCFY